MFNQLLLLFLNYARYKRGDAYEYLKEMNVGKANYLCKGKNTMPASKEDILQDKIFNSQVEQYVNTEDCKVAVLNAFPIFLFDYFK